jgi:lipopolysaccharide/colanic/teichoic acid biosynthesis glycosyltransferase
LGIVHLSHIASTQKEALRSSPFPLYALVKRFMDVVLSLALLVLLSPLLALIAIAIKLDSKGPVIYTQDRVRGEQDPQKRHPERETFSFYKFRSMHTNCDAEIHKAYMKQYINGESHKTNNGSHHSPLYKMKRDPRVTRVGRFLRRTSLDELPQLFNVLKGDMSLVGPRPALPYEVKQYSNWHKQRLIPKAGLTGLWQVRGRTTLSFEEMVRLDIEYAQRRSLWLDLYILLQTIPAVISEEGAW